MRNFIIVINIAVVMIVAAIIYGRESAGIQQSSAIETQLAGAVPTVAASMSGIATINESAGTVTSISREEVYVKDFISELSAARMMNIELGKLASQRGTTRVLKDYGIMNADDQTAMMKDLRRIAKSKELDIASNPGEHRAEQLADISQVHGQKFDSRFLKLMVSDHRRDIKALERATKSTDADVQVFATKYLPIVKNHLKQLEAIKKGR